MARTKKPDKPTKTPHKQTRKSKAKQTTKPKGVTIDVDLPKKVAEEYLNEAVQKGVIQIHLSVT